MRVLKVFFLKGLKQKIYLKILLLGLLLEVFPFFPLAAQGFSGSVFAGTAWSLPTPLRIEQPGQEPIHFTARYRTRPWKGSPYYAYRIGYHHWEAELIHHKLYLQNPPPQVRHFEVSHGYNLAMINYAKPVSAYTLRLGLGLVVAHPEGSVRGKTINPVNSLLGGGYHISGPGAQLSIARELDLSPHLFIVPEVKLSAAWARVPLLGGGSAKIPNLALHVLTGLGFRTAKRKTQH